MREPYQSSCFGNWRKIEERYAPSVFPPFFVSFDFPIGCSFAFYVCFQLFCVPRLFLVRPGPFARAGFSVLTAYQDEKDESS